MPPDEFNAWPESRRHEVQETIQALEQELEQVILQIPRLEMERRNELRKLNRDTARSAVGQSIEEARSKFADIPKVLDHLEAVRGDLVDNIMLFATKADDEGPTPEAPGSAPFQRYEVNVVVTHSADAAQVPVVEELHPTLGNLLGNIEHTTQHGFLVTNFRLIKAGAIHRANGGYLLLDVRNLADGTIQLERSEASAPEAGDPD